jgi:SAM-dependent methyltransferase
LENWPLPQELFDVVVAATSFHWIDPAVRMAKAADALRPGGALAVVRGQHVRGGTEEFFVEVQRCYERFDPETPPGLRLPAVADIDGSDLAEGVAHSVLRPYGVSPLRAGPHVNRRRISGTAGDVLRPPCSSGGRQEWFVACIADLVDGRYGGQVTKRQLIELGV